MIKRTFVLLIVLFCSSTISPMVFDNRYLPLIQKPYISIDDPHSRLYFDLFFISGRRAFGYDITEEEIGIPELLGLFNEGDLGRSMLAAGLPNPLPLAWQKGNFPWAMEGKIQAEGVSFSSQIDIPCNFALGFYWMIMRLNSRMIFTLKPSQASLTIDPADAITLDEDRRQMFNILGLSCGYWQDIGFGDLDAYIRYDWYTEYEYKFRTIDLGLRFGGLFPTGVRRDINNPASIPFGGNGFYGVYGQGEAEFELREDWKLGFWLRASKRLARTLCSRMPALVLSPPDADGNRKIESVESELFGTLVGPARINPGVTVSFLPYFYVENIRGGLGMGLQYTLINHQKDDWVDQRADQSVPSNLLQVIQKSQWTSEYVSLNLFYDFGKVKIDRGFSPIAILNWDIPVNFVLANGVAKTHKVALGIQFNF